jgi:hypothetical protein
VRIDSPADPVERFRERLRPWPALDRIGRLPAGPAKTMVQVTMDEVEQPTGVSSRGLLIVICGLPGSGKTTKAEEVAARQRGLRLGPDEWMTALDISLWDSPMRARVEALQWSVAKELRAVHGQPRHC